MMLHLIRNLPAPVKRWLWNQFIVGKCKEIILADTTPSRDGPQTFCQQTSAALELIRCKDSRRFKRVQKRLRYIINGKLASGAGAYDKNPEACIVDFERFKFEKQPEGARCVYAATIVHEATHGEIERRGISWTKKSRQRIERLCHIETARFMGRIKRELGEGWLVRAYNQDFYESYWRLPLWKRLLLRSKRQRKGESV